MNNYFKGYYYKHQKGQDTIAFIPGFSSNDGAFIQIITKDFSVSLPYQKNNIFSRDGIRVNIKHNDLNVSGSIHYKNLTPIKYDIMGPFKFIKMECTHEIVSMMHDLSGYLVINDRYIDFSGGTGYIEGDSGTSFPSEYVWIQCNDFPQKCSIFLSIAKIPLSHINFNGCICIINYQGKEYRLATYTGVKISLLNKNEIILKQGKYLLHVIIPENTSNQGLFAPSFGQMSRTIYENIACKARFRFFINNNLIFDFQSENASCEMMYNK